MGVPLSNYEGLCIQAPQNVLQQICKRFHFLNVNVLPICVVKRTCEQACVCTIMFIHIACVRRSVFRIEREKQGGKIENWFLITHWIKLHLKCIAQKMTMMQDVKRRNKKVWFGVFILYCVTCSMSFRKWMFVHNTTSFKLLNEV